VRQHKQETQLHNQEISGFPRQVDLFIQAGASRGSKSGAGSGVFASGVGEEYTTVTQVWAVQDLWAWK